MLMRHEYIYIYIYICTILVCVYNITYQLYNWSTNCKQNTSVDQFCKRLKVTLKLKVYYCSSKETTPKNTGLPVSTLFHKCLYEMLLYGSVHWMSNGQLAVFPPSSGHTLCRPCLFASTCINYQSKTHTNFIHSIKILLCKLWIT